MDAVSASNAFDLPEPAPRAKRKAARSADESGKWPVAVRAAVITGSAAALWGLLWLGYKAL
ncbi:hypothetical protein O4H52_15880 [Sphingomonadaceae bacterium G21617-S1]|uniref:hypothetical protein n=1 Tax=Rhizorhabdus sp. TaxID=1968843 RepID=UPI0019B1943F|nr:hypothetical protein [Rhizorhabdus sp.]MBD3762829.1 hypothetical protein [Rhizorhabdus sp.]MCZ4343099.1 hypothetical protein [Sphingomonadaceae bacterium G21617-S1]